MNDQNLFAKYYFQFAKTGSRVSGRLIGAKMVPSARQRDPDLSATSAQRKSDYAECWGVPIYRLRLSTVAVSI